MGQCRRSPGEGDRASIAVEDQRDSGGNIQIEPRVAARCDRHLNRDVFPTGIQSFHFIDQCRQARTVGNGAGDRIAVTGGIRSSLQSDIVVGDIHEISIVRANGDAGGWIGDRQHRHFRSFDHDIVHHGERDAAAGHPVWNRDRRVRQRVIASRDAGSRDGETDCLISTDCRTGLCGDGDNRRTCFRTGVRVECQIDEWRSRVTQDGNRIRGVV